MPDIDLAILAVSAFFFCGRRCENLAERLPAPMSPLNDRQIRAPVLRLLLCDLRNNIDRSANRHPEKY